MSKFKPQRELTTRQRSLYSIKSQWVLFLNSIKIDLGGVIKGVASSNPGRGWLHFHTNTLGKGMNPIILPPAMGK